MSIVRQNSGTKAPAAFPGWPAAEGTAVGGTSSGTWPSAPQIPCATCQENGFLEKDCLLIKWT